MVTVAVATVVLLSAALGYRALLQQRVARTLRIDVPPGVAEERFVRLGGIEQWVSIRGEDARNPVLLVLHGGPGAPYSLLTPTLRCWEKDFTVVQWDRRGAGKTLARNGKGGSGEMSFRRMQEDAIELCAFLDERLPGRKRLLLASSAGTLLGLPLVRARPDLFAAYVGTDFNVGMAANEQVTHAETLAWVAKNGSRADVAFLSRMGSDPRRWDVASYNRMVRLRDRTTRDGRGMAAIFMPLMLSSPAHGLRDLQALAEGLSFCTERLFAEMVAFDAHTVAPSVELPFFVFQGDSDVHTPASVAAAYCETLEAPLKHFELIADSGHMGAFVRPERFLELLRRHVLPAITGAPPRSAPDGASGRTSMPL
ncbi:alpha/beta hydrolase [Archangium violaceum]|uniref:alpha/beta fold hydrolase n=1 Tax=Archangium violaceum TaxID=83451 RepID=UPI00193C1A3D|nr:alpha/beta hydrolase [Archangium violaceum]QRK10103.1 alpha/beta hydrolase [Archangium violaceum]